MTVTRMKCDQGTYLGVCFSDCVNTLEVQGHTKLTNVVFNRVPEGSINYEQAANDGVFFSASVQTKTSV